MRWGVTSLSIRSSARSSHGSIPSWRQFYLFTKLLLKYLPPKKDSLPEEILSMVDMDKFRLQEQQNGSIVLSPGSTELENRY